MKKIFALFTIITLISTSLGFSKNQNQQNSQPNKKYEPVKMNKTLPFSKGVNISSWLESFAAGHSATTYISKQDFIDMKNLGVEAVRIPIHFEEFSSGKPDFIVQEWLWEYIDNAISWCEELKMYVIVDFHNHTESSSKTSSNIEKALLQIWQQIATRYKDKSDFVIYEIMNEPHIRNSDGSINISKWNKIQGNVLNLIRTIDKNHYIIVAGGDFNSIDSILKMPDYKDEKLIYNFHDYAPFLFTHQGASWTDLGKITHVPFPYSKEKMPRLLPGSNSSAQYHYNNYKTASSEEELLKPLDAVVKFANERNVPLMVNEFGVYLKYADKNERINWYKMKVQQYDERNITRLSWDYFGGFGLFKTENISRFPDDLNEELINVMGYKKPSYKNSTWFENALAKNDFTIYNNGFKNGLAIYYWSKANSKENDIIKKDFDLATNEKSKSYIHLEKVRDWDHFAINFRQSCDFSSLIEQDKSLEFEIRVTEDFPKISVYFMNSANSKYEWRNAAFLTTKEIHADGQWHKISIKLRDLQDIGAWDNDKSQWINSQNEFSWRDVSTLRFDVEESNFKKNFDLKNIVIK